MAESTKNIGLILPEKTDNTIVRDVYNTNWNTIDDKFSPDTGNVTKTGTFTAGKITKINNATGIIEEGTNTNADVADAVIKKHEHSNKTELDKLTDGDHDIRTDNPHTITKTQVGLGNVENLKVNLEATTAPGVGNDNTEGYSIGSRWIDKTNHKEYVALDVSTGAAVWTETTQSGGAGDMTKEVYDTGLNNIVDKAETVDDGVGNSSTAINIKDAVTKKHTSGSETLVGDVSGTVGVNVVDKIKSHPIDEAGIENNKILVYKEEGSKFVYEEQSGGGASTFLGLTDTPVNYTDKTGQILRVNATPNAVEFSGIIIETDLTVDSNVKMPTSKAVNDFCETTKKYKGKDYYSALGDDHTYSNNADTDTQPVGENVVFGQLLYFNWAAKKWKLAKGNGNGTVPGGRIALESKGDGEACLMLVKGYIRDDSAFEFAGAMVYVSAATFGAMTSTAPSTATNQLQRVGQAKSAGILFFDPSIDVGEI